MSNESAPNQCPKCGAPIPSGAPQGLCPKCLLAQVALPSEAGSSTETGTVRPTREAVAAAFPQLEVLELIGQGGMGSVFKARQPKLDRLVALKILPQSLAADPAFAERFTREGRVLARMNHPNIVTVHDFGLANGFFYLLMEFVDGVNLRQAMRAGGFTPAQALAVVPKICDALQYAHGEGILHRDIKPENILLDAKGRVKIADFGIAKLVDDKRNDPTLTSQGAALGTPHYMAPEQIEKPGAVDHRADIYSLGVVFYEMLTGELPLGRFAAPSEKTAVDPRLDEVVFRSLEKERERRQQSAAEVKTQVETIAAGTGSEPKAQSSDREAVPATSAVESDERGGMFSGIRVVEERNGRVEVYWPGALQAWAMVFYGCAIGILILWLVGRMNLRILPVWIFLGTVISLALTAYWVNRANRKYRPGFSGAARPALPPLPRWAANVSKLILVVAGLSVLRTVWTYVTSELGQVVLTVPSELLLAATSIALGTRNREWRRAATIGCATLIVLSVAAWAATWYAASNGAFDRAEITPGAALISVVTSLFASLLAPLSLWTLWHREVRPCFGDSVEAPVAGSVPPPGSPDASGVSTASTNVPWARRLLRFVAAAIGVCLLVPLANILVYQLARRPSESNTPATQVFDAATEGNELKPMPELPTTGVTYFTNSAPALPEIPNSATNPLASNPSNTARDFVLRHKLASEMAEELRQILLGKPNRTAQPAANNQDLLVTAPDDVLNRVATFIAVTDWPSPVKNAATGEYLCDTPLATARSFFHACAVEDDKALAQLLSLRLLAKLGGREKELPEFGSAPDPRVVQELQGAWPGKEAAVRAFAAGWTRYPLRQLREEPGVAIGFGARYFVSASFEGSPKDFVSLDFLDDRSSGTRRLKFDAEAPWMSAQYQP